MLVRRGRWSEEEDEKLKTLVRVIGRRNWVHLSQLVETRTPRQCRERYCNFLRPCLDSRPLTGEERILVTRLVNELGTKWATIARYMPSRSESLIKNWWYAQKGRERRALSQRERVDTYWKRNNPDRVQQQSAQG
ncbi:hypothetical protein D6C78_10879 [Aureobasidium pullulans]|uniref:Homeodomain-like protein n=1 Tax=Aureobasidium pullulans TaxID=5580 RepID=A0A4T0B348_AURPU|nr:hypothetical protein D6C78_10879 [Aureobasidium pullulans]